MFQFFVALMAIAAPGSDDEGSQIAQSSGTVIIGENVQIGENTVIEGQAGLVAEPQVPTGKFTTAVEIKPILTATKGNWVAVREFNGQDLVYVTHLWAWRCGLLTISISVNEGPFQDWPLPDCHLEYATPNAILEQDGPPYQNHGLKSVETVSIQITYDDLTTDAASFQRNQVLIP